MPSNDRTLADGQVQWVTGSRVRTITGARQVALQLQSLWIIPTAAVSLLETDLVIGLQLQSLWTITAAAVSLLETDSVIGLQLQSRWIIPTAAVS